jgi:hypothetical protein
MVFCFILIGNERRLPRRIDPEQGPGKIRMRAVDFSELADKIDFTQTRSDAET